MSIHLQTGLYVRIEEAAPGQVGPLEQGFSRDRLYRVLDLQDASSLLDAGVVLANDRDEICFVLEPHVRIALIAPERFELRLARNPFEDWTEVPTEDLIADRHLLHWAQPWASNAAD